MLICHQFRIFLLLIKFIDLMVDYLEVIMRFSLKRRGEDDI